MIRRLITTVRDALVSQADTWQAAAFQIESETASDTEWAGESSLYVQRRRGAVALHHLGAELLYAVAGTRRQSS